MPLRVASTDGLATFRGVASSRVAKIGLNETMRPTFGVCGNQCGGLLRARPDVSPQLDRVRIIECAYVDAELTGSSLERDGDAGAAGWTELHSEPSPAQVRPVGIRCQRPTGDFDVVAGKVRDFCIGAASSALAERAVAGVRSQSLSKRAEARRATKATTFSEFEHRATSSGGVLRWLTQCRDQF